MQVDGAGLREQRTFVRYQSQQEAVKFIGSILTDERGVALLYGPKLSGKSAIAEQFIRETKSNVSIAVVDASRMETSDLLSRILEQFGYHVSLDSVDEMLNMLTVFVAQQTRSNQAPVLVVKNVQNMFPSALGALCKLAALIVDRRFALRLVLVSDRDIDRIVNSPNMRAVAERVIGKCELGS